MEETKKQYEISFLSKNENGAAMMVSHIQTAGGEIVHEGTIKEMELAYPIKKVQTAYFGCICAKLPTESIEDMTKAINLENDILRFLVITPPFRSEQSEQIQTQNRKPSSSKAYADRKKSASPAKPQAENAISNELLEEKLEEILS